ncbi:microtubule-associated protein RP/EB family member 2 isoform X2 [Rhinatrema bivittatum]|uniref:microtubule-associated protein RP/EB family member 2 isoform X2 n=1 Tax=Rhinatrema bivittatum TaxID=194408 RepID=UPI00112B140A|nr:microtubule-associated protein RP/EB family member 2 isoform X2 [Rhinatrema bivittatum]XP_029447092.1 microtubule-associated protein RP/EB family member 2 isoform X2 [Rhinatrema bivittatum]
MGRPRRHQVLVLPSAHWLQLLRLLALGPLHVTWDEVSPRLATFYHQIAVILRELAKSLCFLFHSLKRKRNVSQGNSAAVVWGANLVTVPVISGQMVTESGRLQSMLATQGMPASPAIPANTLPAPVQPTLPPIDVNPLLRTANSAVQIPTQQLGYEVLCGVTSLAHSVPDTIKGKILKREYIDIFSLLVTDMEGGSTEAKDKRPKVAKNIQNWTRAFHIFMSVIVEHEPAHAPFLIRYMDTILTAQRRGGWAWLNYDMLFRKSMAHNPAVSWQHRLIDLWLDEMTLQKSSWAESGYIIQSSEGEGPISKG